jgi:hypothetical protein
MPTPDENLREGYPKDAKYDFEWPVDFPYDAEDGTDRPNYPGGSLFPPDDKPDGGRLLYRDDDVEIWEVPEEDE